MGDDMESVWDWVTEHSLSLRVHMDMNGQIGLDALNPPS